MWWSRMKSILAKGKQGWGGLGQAKSPDVSLSPKQNLSGIKSDSIQLQLG